MVIHLSLRASAGRRLVYKAGGVEKRSIEYGKRTSMAGTDGA